MVCTRDDDKCDDESSQKYECVHDRGHSTAINPDFGTLRLTMTTFSFEEVSVPVPVLVRVLAIPAAPPPESTLPPMLLPSAVVPSVARSGSDLLSGCVIAERVVGFDGPAGACQ